MNGVNGSQPVTCSESSNDSLAQIVNTHSDNTKLTGSKDQQSMSHQTPATNSNSRSTFKSPDDAAKSFASWKKGTVEHIYWWTETWRRALIQSSTGKAFCNISRKGDDWALQGSPEIRKLYRIDELPSDGAIIFCGSEKPCDAGWSIGLSCVTSGGVDYTQATDWRPLRGREVVILPDHDDQGTCYAHEVARHLTSIDPAAMVKIVELPRLGDGEDLYDFINKYRNSLAHDEIKSEIMALIGNTSSHQVPKKPDTLAIRWPEPIPLPNGVPSVLPFIMLCFRRQYGRG